MQINTKDKIVQRVLRKMDKRSLVGQKKYGQTMQNEIETGKKDLHMFLTDVQEELMDALLYIESAKICIRDNRTIWHGGDHQGEFNIEVNDEEEL